MKKFILFIGLSAVVFLSIGILDTKANHPPGCEFLSYSASQSTVQVGQVFSLDWEYNPTECPELVVECYTNIGPIRSGSFCDFGSESHSESLPGTYTYFFTWVWNTYSHSLSTSVEVLPSGPPPPDPVGTVNVTVSGLPSGQSMSYQGSPNNFSGSLSSNTTDTKTGVPADTYSLTASDVSGCTKTVSPSSATLSSGGMIGFTVTYGCGPSGAVTFNAVPYCNQGDWHVGLSWNFPAGEDRYNLSRIAGGPEISLAGGGSFSYTSTSFVDTSPPSNTGITYIVEGTTASEELGDSAEITIGPLNANGCKANISVSSTEVTSWTINPGGISGSGTSNTHQIGITNMAGEFYTITAAPVAGRTLTVTNSDNGAETLLISPGQNKSFTLTYTPNPVGTINVTVSGLPSGQSMSYQGSPNNFSGSLSSNTTDTKTGVPADTYSLTASDVSGCTKTVSPSSATLSSGGMIGFTVTYDCAQPNLSPSDVSYGVITAGVPTTFSATVYNLGSASTGSGFQSFYQITYDVGTPLDNISFSMNPIAANGNAIATSPSYTFASPGNYLVRVCADKSDPTNLGTIAESDEDDNCSLWAPISVGQQTFTFTLSVNPSSVSINQPGSVQTTLTKSLSTGVSQPVQVDVSGMPSGVGVAFDGNRDCAPNCSTTITFTADGTTPAGSYPITITGTPQTGSPVTRNATLNIVGNPIGGTCTASPSPAKVGQPVTWTVSMTGGTPPYIYIWGGSAPISSVPQGPTNSTTDEQVVVYPTVGQKFATVIVNGSLPISCDGAVTSTPGSPLRVVVNPTLLEF